MFWAGESPSLETQAQSAITGNLAGNGDPIMIEERLAQVPEYVALFKEAFGIDRPAFPHVLKAIATFERAEVISDDSPFDRYMRGERSALSDEAGRGLILFQGKAGCIRCHNGPLATDESFHHLGGVPHNSFFDENILAQVAFRYQHYSRGVDEDLRAAKTNFTDVSVGQFVACRSVFVHRPADCQRCNWCPPANFVNE